MTHPQPYEPMLNLFAAYADEEQAEVQVVKSRPSPSRAPSASRKKKGDEPEMFNLFSQENMYDEAATQEDMTGERAAAEAKWQERRQKFEEERKKEMEPRPFTGEIRPEYKNGSIVKSGEQYGYLRGLGTPDVQFHPLKLTVTQQYRAAYYIPLREAYHNLYNAEAETETEQPELREELVRRYDSFYHMFRELNGKDNSKFLLMDAGGREILSLERSVNGKIQKSDIFSVPVSFNANEVTHVDTPLEALAASLNKFGEVNLGYMENLSEIGRQELLKQLDTSIFYNPMMKNHEIKDRFIAGNVVAKAEWIENYLKTIPMTTQARNHWKPYGKPYRNRSASSCLTLTWGNAGYPCPYMKSLPDTSLRQRPVSIIRNPSTSSAWTSRLPTRTSPTDIM